MPSFVIRSENKVKMINSKEVFMKKSMIVLFALVLAVSLFSCKSEDGGAGAPGFPGQQGEQGEQGEQGDPGETEYPRLYVAGCFNFNVCVFNEAGLAGWSHGDIYPDREIYLSGVTVGVFLVKTESSSSLYVSDGMNHQILVFSNADTIDGDIAPTKTIESVTVPAEGTAPACNSIDEPHGFVIDNDRLYLANVVGNSISIFRISAVGAMARVRQPLKRVYATAIRGLTLLE